MYSVPTSTITTTATDTVFVTGDLTVLPTTTTVVSIGTTKVTTNFTLGDPISTVFDLHKPRAPHCIPLGDDEGSFRLLRVLSDRESQRVAFARDERWHPQEYVQLFGIPQKCAITSV
ncbi:hypothetical protein QM012_007568 [Aureobasidium pullulans]|uniref:S-adenosyl-L-methionine-dependent methyltransferase n=1 Tax=Aureobasidium pullulans TaxID=5580 RepID=A0ABR0TNB1_AURPU